MTSNRTSQEESMTIVSNSQRIAFIFLYSLVLLVGSCGNTFVVYIFGWRQRRGRKNSEFLLMSLGIVDLMFSVLAPLWMILSTVSINTNYLHILNCIGAPIYITITVTVSEMLLILIWYDRYRAIVTPMKKRFCRKLVFVGVAAGTLLSIITSIPPILRTIKGPKESRCYDYNYNPILGLVHGIAFVARDIVAFSVMAYFIYKMFAALKEHAKFRKSASSIQLKDGEFQKIRKILYLVLAFFTICICPSDISYLFLNAYFFNRTFTEDGHQLAYMLLLVGTILQIINSCVNVFIYSVAHPEFKKLLTGMWKSITDLFLKSPTAELGTNNAGLDISVENPRS